MFKLVESTNPTGMETSTNCVVNLVPDLHLTEAHLRLLQRGLSFVPSIDINHRDKNPFQQEVLKYHRRIKIALYFETHPDRRPLPFQGASTWTPPPWTLPPEVQKLERKDLADIDCYYKPFLEKFNLTKAETRILKQLKKNPDIVIKKADKGSALVIQSKDNYVWEAERQLHDQRYYRKLDHPIYLKTIPVITRIINKLLLTGHITQRQAAFLRGNPNPRLRRFYTLPKIHKDPDTWPLPHKIPPGRPIVSDCESETYATALFIQHYLHPVSIVHPSYVKDTSHFLQLLQTHNLPETSRLFTLDVDSLYTNIDTGAGLRAVKRALQKYPETDRPDKAIMTLLHLNLIKNDFTFNGNYYLQVKGTAMGKLFAPSYANIFMASWEEDALSDLEKSPLIYLRYLDDIFGVWLHSEPDFYAFVAHLNSADPSITLKATIHPSQIDFLDITVFKGHQFHKKHILDTKVYFKPTNTHALLHKNSFHPKHTFSGVVSSQILRFRRISTWKLDFFHSAQTLFRVLRTRGYSRTFLRKCYKRAMKSYERTNNIQREQTQNQQQPQQILPLISTFSTIHCHLHRKIKTNFSQYLTDRGLLKNHKPISAFKRNPNLGDFLVRALLKQPQEV